MGKFDNLSAESLGAMGDALSQSVSERRRAETEHRAATDAMETIAHVAVAMKASLDDNTEAMRDMEAGVTASAERAEHAAGDAYGRVQDEAAKTLRMVNEAAARALENSQRSVEDATRQLEAARRAAMIASVVTCVVVALAGVGVTLFAVGELWLQFRLGAVWADRYGWLALPLLAIASAAVGALACRKLMGR